MKKQRVEAAATKHDLTQAFIQMEKRLDKKFTAIDGKFTALERSMDRKLARQKGDIFTVLDLRLAEQKEDILRQMDTKLATQQEAIIKGVAKDVHDMFMPTIEEHDNRLDSLEHHNTHPPLHPVI